jgi:hypothetical protein
MTKRDSRTAIVAVFVIGGVLFAAALGVCSRSGEQRAVCARGIDHKLHAIAEIGDRKLRLCCVRCALTQARRSISPYG